MEPSCGWICNPTIVWLDELAVVKILDRIENPQDVPRFDPVLGSNNNPLRVEFLLKTESGYLRDAEVT